MGEPLVQESRFPALTQVWQDKLAEIDDQIVGCCNHHPQSPDELVENTRQQLEAWFERLDLDAGTKAEYDRARAAGKFLPALLNDRISFLAAEGRIRFPR